MNIYQATNRLLVQFAEHIGDRLDIEFRRGTDAAGKEYNTNLRAHAALYRALDDTYVEIQTLISCIENDARAKLQEELKELLGVNT